MANPLKKLNKYYIHFVQSQFKHIVVLGRWEGNLLPDFYRIWKPGSAYLGGHKLLLCETPTLRTSENWNTGETVVSSDAIWYQCYLILKIWLVFKTKRIDLVAHKCEESEVSTIFWSNFFIKTFSLTNVQKPRYIWKSAAMHVFSPRCPKNRFRSKKNLIQNFWDFIFQPN